MKKIAILALVFVFAFALVACGGTEPTKLGDSSLSIVIPEGYALTEDDFDEGQVAYYYKDDTSVDFDVYQWRIAENFTLDFVREDLITAYDVVPEDVEYNGISCLKYSSEEEYEGDTYTVVYYLFADDAYLVQLCFWTVGTDAEYAAIEDIVKTLKRY